MLRRGEPGLHRVVASAKGAIPLLAMQVLGAGQAVKAEPPAFAGPESQSRPPASDAQSNRAGPSPGNAAERPGQPTIQHQGPQTRLLASLVRQQEDPLRHHLANVPKLGPAPRGAKQQAAEEAS